MPRRIVRGLRPVRRGMVEAVRRGFLFGCKIETLGPVSFESLCDGCQDLLRNLQRRRIHTFLRTALPSSCFFAIRLLSARNLEACFFHIPLMDDMIFEKTAMKG